MSFYYVYVLYSYKDQDWYTGYTSDLKSRIKEHKAGTSPSTKHRRPLKLIYFVSISCEKGHTIKRENGDAMTRAKLLSKMRIEMRKMNYGFQTERTYQKWINGFLSYHELTDPTAITEEQIMSYITYLGEDEKITIHSQRQVLAALLFLADKVINQSLYRTERSARKVASE